MSKNIKNNSFTKTGTPHKNTITLLNQLIKNNPTHQKEITNILESYLTVINENNELKQAIVNNEKTIEDFFNNSLNGIYRIDAEENYVMVNQIYATMCGYASTEMTQPGFKISKTWAIAEEKNLLLDEVKNRELKGLIIKFKRKDGSEGHQELSLRAIFDENGSHIGYDGFAKDVSDRLKSMNAEIEARRSAEFLVDLMSHDINNINQGLMILLEYILVDPSLPKRHGDPLKLALEQVNYTTELIKNVKKLQSILEKNVNLTSQDPYKAIQVAAEAASGTFSDKKLKLDIDFNENQIKVQADDFLKDLFFNLFHNSLKHTPDETVRIDITLHINKIDHHVEIHVMDHGPGIPDVEKKRILQRRLGAKGSGIGLTIVNYLLDRYDGYIQVEDRIAGNQSSGSKFILVLNSEESNWLQ